VKTTDRLAGGKEVLVLVNPTKVRSSQGSPYCTHRGKEKVSKREEKEDTHYVRSTHTLNFPHPSL